LLSPLVALIATPELAINLLSSTKTQTSIHYHYTAAIIPPLVVAAVYALGRVPAKRVAPVLVAAALVSGWWLGPLPIWQYVPRGEDLQAHEARVSEHDRVVRRAIALIPDDVPVSATNTIGAHLSARERIFSFPVVREAEWVITDARRPSYRDRAHAPSDFAIAMARLTRGPWKPVFDEDGVVVLRRGSSAAASTQ
jgi:uncharacterized membrane protein